MGETGIEAWGPLKFGFDSTNLSDHLKVHVQAFHDANTVREQQNILKELPKYICKPVDEHNVALLLCHMFLLTSAKHPLKKTCIRILLSMHTEIVCASMTEQIKGFISNFERRKKRLPKTDSGLDLHRDEDGFVSRLQGVFSNFAPGIEALNKVINDVFLFILRLFFKSIDIFISETLPMEFAQQMLYNVTKFLDTLVHQCDTPVHIRPNSTEMLVKCYKVIRNDRVLFNTKTHCGSLMVTAVVHSPDNMSQEDMRKLSDVLNIPEINQDTNLLTALLENSKACYTSQICILSGIVHICPLMIMSHYMINTTPVAIYIFQNLLDLAKRRSGYAVEILEISRSLVGLCPLIEKIRADYLEDVMKNGWDYIWMHLDHFIDAVRSDTQKLLRSFIKVTLHLSIEEHEDGTVTIPDRNNPYLLMFISAITEIIEGHSPNFKALAHISSAMRCRVLLEFFPQLPRKLLRALHNPSIGADVYIAYERLMEQHHKEMPLTWITTWVHPLMPLTQPEGVIGYVLRIFNAAFRLNKEVVRLVTTSPKFSDQELRALLGCMIQARKLDIKLDNLLKTPYGKPWNGIGIFNVLHLQILACHKSAEIRLLILTLLVECQRSTELFTMDDFKLLLVFFKYNVTSPYPNFRQNLTGLYKKAMNRLRDSYYVIIRDKRKEEIRFERGERNRFQHYRELITYYNHFIRIIFEQLTRGLYYQADNGRRAISLELLIHLKSCLPEEIYHDLWSKPDRVRMLHGTFDDTYESNLIMLRKILLEIPRKIAFPQTYLKAFEVFMKQHVEQIAFEVKPNLTTSATYAMSTYLHSESATSLLRYRFSLEVTEFGCAPLLMQRELSAQINTELALAEQDVMFAAKHAPIHGLLFCMRSLIQKEELDTKYWRIVPNVVRQCLKMVEIASPIINSSAPEGYNPENIDYEDAQVTPQLVLLYAWRTIKEVSLLFGDLEINHPDVKAILKRENLLEEIAKYFLELFEAAKHRGAYEQGYVGFAKLTEKLWTSNCEWATLPEKWLENTLALISSTDANICATRRSAGIPFMVQAILITEPKPRQNKSFHHCMRYLLNIAEDFSEENKKSAIHSMNTLRALYRHNQLGEVVAPYVARGVMIAIIQFSHSDWAIRNSATLMFSSLMMRIFGVQRLKDSEELSIKNRLSFKVFTTRYPELYKFLFEKLDEFTSTEEEHVSLYPVLLILCRIYLTYDAKVENQKLHEHLQSIVKATSRNIHTIRESAVQASITFQSFLNQHVRLPCATNNQIHAMLLNLRHQLNYARTALTLNHFKPLFVILMEAGRGVAQTCATLLMNILIDFIKYYPYSEEDLDNYKQLIGYLHTTTELSLSTCSSYVTTKFALYLHVIMKIPHSDDTKRAFLCQALVAAVSSTDEELNIFALNCIKYISNESTKRPADFHELEYDFVQTLEPTMKNLLSNLLRMYLTQKRVFMDLFDIIRNRSRRFALKVCQVLYNYPSIVYTIRPKRIPVTLSHQIILDYLCHQATNIDSHMFVALTGLIGKFVAGSKEPLNLRQVICIMEEYGSDDDCTVDERFSIANFILKNYTLLIDPDFIEEKLRIRLWNIYLDLMQDDEHVIREYCTQISIRILNEATDAFPLQEHYFKHFPLIPERLSVEVITRLPFLLGRYQAMRIYAMLTFQYEEADEYTDEATVFERQRRNTYKESRPFLAVARHQLATCLWYLNVAHSYTERSIFLEEHLLMVTTRLLNLLNRQDETDDRSLCLTVLKYVIAFVAKQPLGTLTIKRLQECFPEVFDMAAREERSDRKMSACMFEVRHFFACVLFTCHAGRDDCKCDNV